MRRCLLAVLTAALLLASALPAAAHPGVTLGPTLPTDLTHASTDNVDYLGRFPEHTGTAGGQPSADGTKFYLTDPRGVYVYDTTTPESPTLLGSLTLYQTGTGAALAQEDPNTNGEILLVDGSPTPHGTAKLNVIDVSDPANLKVLSTVAVTDHTWNCVSGIDAEGEQNSCAYAYGRTGSIVDLRNPAAATLLPNTWRTAVKYTGYTHDMTEVRPGLVFTAGAAAILMDTTDPAAPVQLTRIEEKQRFSSLGYHSVEWADGGTSPHVVLGTEIAPRPIAQAPAASENTAGSDCKGDNSVIETWDATSVIAALEQYELGVPAEDAFATAAFTKVDSYDAGGRGIFLQGDAPGHVLYCAHWMEQHPSFSETGLVTVSYYDRGTRFLKVAEDGTMTEVGWMTPAEGYSGSSQWITDEIVYVMDYRRGLEVLRLNPEPATGVESGAPDAIAVGSSYVPASALNLDTLSNIALGSFGVSLLGLGIKRRRR